MTRYCKGNNISRGASDIVLLLNVTPGQDEGVLKMLKAREHVKQVYQVYGLYDMVVQIRADSYSKAQQEAAEIKKMDEVRSMLPMTVASLYE